MSRQHGNIVFKTVAEGRVNCPSGSWTALRVGATNQAKRQVIWVQNRSKSVLLYTTDNTFDIRYAMGIGAGEMIEIPLADNLTLYGNCRSGSIQVTVWELS